MNIDYRKFPPPGEIDGLVTDLKGQRLDEQSADSPLTLLLGEAIKHLERYRDMLRTAYIVDSNKEKYDRLMSGRFPRGEW